MSSHAWFWQYTILQPFCRILVTPERTTKACGRLTLRVNLAGVSTMCFSRSSAASLSNPPLWRAEAFVHSQPPLPEWPVIFAFSDGFARSVNHRLVDLLIGIGSAVALLLFCQGPPLVASSTQDGDAAAGNVDGDAGAESKEARSGDEKAADESEYFADMRSPQRARTAYLRSLLEVLHFMLRSAGLR